MTPTIKKIQANYKKAILSSQKLYARRRRKDTAGAVRYTKGKLVEDITKDIISIAWSRISSGKNLLKMDRKKISVTTNGETYKLSQDIHIHINDVFKISVECKSYTEVAMYKRILMDAHLLKCAVPTIESFFVVQLENFLGGDYGSQMSPKGSDSVITLDRVFPDLNINIITLLDGDRHIERPLHKSEYFKPLTDERLEYAINQFVQSMTKCLNNRE